MRRFPEEIACSDNRTVVIADDNSMWTLVVDESQNPMVAKWVRLPDLPDAPDPKPSIVHPGLRITETKQ